MNWFKRKKKVEDVNVCEFSEMMEGAMSIQGKAMVNQTELNVAYQAYSLLRWKDMYGHYNAIEEAAKIVVELEDEIEKQKSSYE